MSLENIAASGSEVKKSEETKEERRARKAAKKLGTAHASSITTFATSSGPSSSILSSQPSKAEIGVEKPVLDGIPDATIPVKKEKRKRVTEDVTEGEEASAIDRSVPVGTRIDEEEERKRRKKEKKEKKAAKLAAASKGDVPDNTDTSPPESSVPPTEPLETDTIKVKKEKKRKTPLSESTLPTIQEIFADTELSEPAQLALKYVHEHSTSLLQKDQSDGKAWKFQKKRQAWLTRHLWDSEELPERYVDMVLVYLKTTQGGARATLIELAKSHVKAATPPECIVAAGGVTEGGEDNVAENVGEQSGAKGETEEPGEAKIEFKGEAVDPAVLATRRDRGERLLKAMGAR